MAFGYIPPAVLSGGSKTGGSFLGSLGNVLNTAAGVAGTAANVYNSVKAVVAKPPTVTYTPETPKANAAGTTTLGLPTWAWIAIGGVVILGGVWLVRKS